MQAAANKPNEEAAEPLLVSIDAGTQSIRAVLIDLRGTVRDIEKVAMEPYFAEHPGWAEQDPAYMWRTLCQATQGLMQRRTPTECTAIKGFSLTTQRGTVLNLDANGESLRPAMVWLDRRQAQLENWPSPPLSLALRSVGMLSAVRYGYRECEANWLRQHQPEVWARTAKYVYLSGYFTYRLTGQFVDSVGSMVGYMPFDFRRQTWAAPGHLNRRMFPVEQDKLFDLVKPSERIGHLSQRAAQETGLPEGLPMIAAASDKAGEVLGSGCLDPTVASLSYGTTATVQTTNRRYVEVLPFFPPYPGATPDSFNTEVMVYRGFWMINWFKQQFGYPEVNRARELGTSPEELFDALIAQVPPGAQGLTLQPYWSAGVKEPGLEAKGAIIGFGDVHTRAHIYRAIVEGLAYALRHGLERTERRLGHRIHSLRVSGGGSQSEAILQLTADVFGLPVQRPHTFETSALGAAINAAVGLGLYNSFDAAVAAMTRVGATYQPHAQHRQLYNELYLHVYRRMYARLQPLYHAIRRITGYPKY